MFLLEKRYKNQKIIFGIVLFISIIGILLLLIIKSKLSNFMFISKGCMMNQILHIYCPGCGGTRSINYLLNFRFLSSIIPHSLPFFLIIIYLKYMILSIYTFFIMRDGKLYNQVTLA